MSSALELARAAVDEAQAEARDRLGTAIVCREGCSRCCTADVQASPAEVEDLHSRLTAVQRERVLGLAQLARQQAANLSLTRCPFLDSEGRCEVYSQRPLSCRGRLVLSPAAWCSVDSHRHDSVISVSEVSAVALRERLTLGRSARLLVLRLAELG